MAHSISLSRRMSLNNVSPNISVWVTPLRSGRVLSSCDIRIHTPTLNDMRETVNLLNDTDYPNLFLGLTSTRFEKEKHINTIKIMTNIISLFMDLSASSSLPPSRRRIPVVLIQSDVRGVYSLFDKCAYKCLKSQEDTSAARLCSAAGEIAEWVFMNKYCNLSSSLKCLL